MVTRRGRPKSRLVFLGTAGANVEFGNELPGRSRQAHLLLLCNTHSETHRRNVGLVMSFTTYKARVGWRATQVVFVLVCQRCDVGVLFQDPLFSESISAIARTMGTSVSCQNSISIYTINDAHTVKLVEVETSGDTLI